MHQNMRGERMNDLSPGSLDASVARAGVKGIAFYLPQYHPIPENDAWWGMGFTEWRNVATARPLFPDHYQPHLPADLGFYDLRVPETREAQAELARDHGIYGFCYYHYWFNGRRLLNRPFDEVLRLGSPRFPFCICWANENWTRRWDGQQRQVLLAQYYSPEDDLAHIHHLLPVFADDRYIRIDGRPLLLVYVLAAFPDPLRTADIWREEVRRAGLGDLYLAAVESNQRYPDIRSYGFDAAVEFAPDWRARVMGFPRFQRKRYDLRARVYLRLQRHGWMSSAYQEHNIYSYDALARDMLAKPRPDFPWFRGVTPNWDNSPRRRLGARILQGSTPEAYGRWLSGAVQETLTVPTAAERIIFINAWNEWAEGNHLEPDLKWGRAYLEATRRAFEKAEPKGVSEQNRRHQAVGRAQAPTPAP
jgi:lipopolysaccharide biosynthesis protein